MKIKLNRGSIIRIFGPALLKVVDGRVSMLGKVFGVGENIVIHKLRSYSLLSEEDSIIEVNMGPGASIQEPNLNEEPIFEWYKAAEEIISKGYTSTIILGPVDSGKSSLSVLLANKALSRGISPVAIIDSDVGQADIGPPGFISVAIVTSPVIWMRELSPDAMRFIGDIRPQHHIDHIINEVSNLINYAKNKGSKFIIIDTDGWIQDIQGISYKYKLITRIKPDAIIVLGELCKGVFRKLRRIGIDVIELNTPSILRTRTRDERRKLRSEKYKQFLEGAPVQKYYMDEIILNGIPLFYGLELDPSEVSSIAGAEVLYATKTPDILHIVTTVHIRNIQSDKLKNTYGVDKIRLYHPGLEKGLYIGIEGDSFSEYPGLIEYIDYKNKVIGIRTIYRGVPKVIKLSRIRLTREYTEQLMD